MAHYPEDQVCTPPELPAYLKSVYDLKPILGIPSDGEIIGIHDVLRVANKVIDVPGIHNSVLLAQLAEHLFDAQMAKYRSRYPCSIFSLNTLYTPPPLPAHVVVQLKPIHGAPSEEQVVEVQDALRLYQKCADIPSMFDSQVHAELSQHLFDIQMAKYIRRGLNRTDIISREGVTSQPTNPTCVTDHANEESTKTTNNAGTGADIAGLYQSTQVGQDRAIHAAIERSNQITEQANQLVERSNQLVERFNRIADQSNQLFAERSSLSAEQSNRFAERFNELLERLTQHSELSNQNSTQFNQLMGELVKPVAKFENILGNINRVLVGIQHAIVRNHKGNTTSALECLVNEKGETQAVSRTTEHTSYQWFSERYTNSANSLLPVTIDGVCHDSYIHNAWLGDFLRFYGIGEGICEDDMSSNLKGGMKQDARKRLRNYLSSCLG